MKKKTTLLTITEFQETHQDTYDYSLVEYTNAKTKVTIICNEHGPFRTLPGHHRRGCGCPDCADYSASQTDTQDETIKQFEETHQYLYDYSLVDYKNAKTKVIIICKEHGPFDQEPNSHKKGRGCPDCNAHAYRDAQTYSNRQTTLYYVKIGDLYKIGITLKNIRTRFAADIKKGIKIDVVKKWVYEDGAEAFNREQKILIENKKYRYTGEKILIGGNSELFTADVLNLDTTPQQKTSVLF